ncbi:hypothetical protein P4O66_011756, partial [Electrophorus voltai]
HPGGLRVRWLGEQAVGGEGGTRSSARVRMTDHQPKWSCEYCTYENWPSAIKCTMCRAQRPTAPIITEEPFKSSSRLDSHLCPTPEGSSVLICPDSSARPRVRIVDELPETTSKWSCHMCTYLNWPRAIRCTQCLSQRQQGPSESPQTSELSSRPAPAVDPCEEYNDRNRLNTHIQHWACSACTYENWPKSLRCVVCDHPKPSGTPETEQQDAEPESTTSLPVANEQDRTTGGGGGQWEQGGAEEALTSHLHGAGGGVVEGDLAAVQAYKSSGGDIARQLTSDEVRLLNRPSAFNAGFTLVHLAIRFQRQDMLSVLLTEVSQQAAKCIPAMVCPELTEQIRREVASGLHRRKGEFPCYFLTDITTFTLPADIEDLPPNVQEKLFDEVLDRDVQKELEEESPIINWSLELGTRLDSRLYALWNRTAGDCLLDSVLQATWGIYDKDSILRKSLHDSLHDCSHWFYTRWKEWESWYSQSFGLHFSLREEQWQEDWAFILSLASQLSLFLFTRSAAVRQPGASLEQTHIFVLAHILRRPIIVYGVKYYKSFRGETLGYTRFQAVFGVVVLGCVWGTVLGVVVHDCVWGTELGVVVHGCVWGTELRVVVLGCVWGTELGVVVQGCVWGTELGVVVLGCVWGTELGVVVLGCVWGTELGVVVQGCVWGTELGVVVHGCVRGTELGVVVLGCVWGTELGVVVQGCVWGTELGVVVHGCVQGVYLPLLWEQSFCWKSPIALGYTRGHFSALVAMENDGYDNRGAGANLNTDDDVTVTFLPLVDSERKLLHIHFLSAQEMGTEEQQERLLRQWLDCCVTEGGVLVALQKSSRRRSHPLVTQMVEKWLDGYRQLENCPALSDGEEEEEDEDE